MPVEVVIFSIADDVGEDEEAQPERTRSRHAANDEIRNPNDESNGKRQ
jgi:hypothetical protein